MKKINRRNYIVYIRNSKRFFPQDKEFNHIEQLQIENKNQVLIQDLKPLSLDVSELNVDLFSLEKNENDSKILKPINLENQTHDLKSETKLEVKINKEQNTDSKLEVVLENEHEVNQQVEIENQQVESTTSSTKSQVFKKNIFGKIDRRKNFNFEEFEKNVKYKEFSDGSKKKIVAELIDLRLTFTNPSRPEDRALVLRSPSIQFYEGEVHAIIGESGSGKSVITSLLYGLAGKTANIEAGKVLLYNNEVQNFKFKDWERSKYLGRVISAVFQNPMSTLNPTMKIGKQIMEGMLINGIVKNRKEAKKQAIEYLKLTKINNPEEVMELYPHELSGGMIQRVVIASIVSLHPKILVLDEPTTALDPTVQALVLDVIRELQQKFKMCVIFITHDLGVVASIANYISIMYAGQIIEEGTRDEILWHPQHPYTWGLIMSMPDVNKGERLATIRGSVPSRLNEIVGDAFAVRNEYALTRDFTIEPDMYYISDTHRAKTALLDKQAPEYEPPAIIKAKWEAYKAKQNA